MFRFIRPIALRIPDEIERHASWLELFFDLVYAIILTELGTRLFHDFTYFGVLECIGLLMPILWTWTSYTVFSARFDNDDSFHWIMTFIIMFAGIVMAIQISDAFEGGSLGFSIGFLISQIALVILYLRSMYGSRKSKTITALYAIGIGSGGIILIFSLFLDWPLNIILWAFVMSMYLAIPWIGRKNILSRAPLHPVYIPERFGSFTIIILGQTVASVVLGLKFAHWNATSITTSILSFILAVTIWGQYYRITEIADFKGTLHSGQAFIYTHIPLIISLITLGVCAEKFIVAPKVMDETDNHIFCFAVLLYLTSFYLLQYTTTSKFKFRGKIFVVLAIAILALFSFNLLPAVYTLLGLDIIFVLLFFMLYMLPKKTHHKKEPR